MRRKPTIRIRPHEAGTQVLDLLATRFTYHSREEWQDRIGSGHLLLNQQRTHPTCILEPGDTLEYVMPETPEPPVDTCFSVLFEDDDLMVVDKPGNLPCHPAGRYFEHTLWTLLKVEFNLPHLALVNRIDRETSGIVLLAKTSKAALFCRQQFENRQVYKRYVALVEGEFSPGRIEARGYVARDPDSPVRKKRRFYTAEECTEIQFHPKACCTLFFKTQTRRGISRVEAIPETGRPHQIRTTLLSLGYPVVGDKLYGVDETIFLRFINSGLSERDKQRLRLPRQALHSAELHMTHPGTGRPLRFRAPLPLDMQRIMEP